MYLCLFVFVRRQALSLRPKNKQTKDPEIVRSCSALCVLCFLFVCLFVGSLFLWLCGWLVFWSSGFGVPITMDDWHCKIR